MLPGQTVVPIAVQAAGKENAGEAPAVPLQARKETCDSDGTPSPLPPRRRPVRAPCLVSPACLGGAVAHVVLLKRADGNTRLVLRGTQRARSNTLGCMYAVL